MKTIIPLPLLLCCLYIPVFAEKPEPIPKEELPKTEAEWKEKLTDREFGILRKEGTERAFSGDLLKEDREGWYTCAGCGNPVFASDTKFKSGTGWPSFYRPLSDGAVGTKEDRTLWMTRTEAHCAHCGGHLGHVFEDGPKPTGLRYCLNSAALDFVPKTGGDGKDGG